MITARLTYKIILVGSTVTKGVYYGQLGQTINIFLFTIYLFVSYAGK